MRGLIAFSTLPSWARWNPAGADRPWTIGVEEELMLLDPERELLPAWSSTDVLEHLPATLVSSATAEPHACALELRTGVHATVDGAAAELTTLRAKLGTVVAERGLRAAAAGTHPLALWTQTEITAAERYRYVHDTTNELARREPTFALHVHVAVPGREAATRALDGLRADLPALLALAANSPFWQARDTGLACARVPVSSMVARTGIPPRVESYRHYVALIESLPQPRAIRDSSSVWWDARLRPHLGTVEVRVMDAQTRLLDTAALAAFVQCLVRLRVETPPAALSATVLTENRFRATRDGVSAELVEAGARRVSAADRVSRLLDDCAEIADDLGCRRELEHMATLLAHPGYARQRAAAAPGKDLQRVLTGLAADFGSVRHRPLSGPRLVSPEAR